MSTYKKITFTAVGNLATFLGNIKQAVNAAELAGGTYGWTVDRYVAGSSGELLIHSTGMYGLQNLYYSMKLNNPTSECAHMFLSGQTGYNSGNNYDAQPGKFTVYSNGLPTAWSGTGDSHPANFVRAPIEKMIVFVNKQNIVVLWKEDQSLSNLSVYPVWKRFILGAMDSFNPAAELYLNFIDEVVCSTYGWGSSPFMGAVKFHPYSNWTTSPKPCTGFLYKQPYDSVAENKDRFNDYGVEYWHSSLVWATEVNYYQWSWNGSSYYNFAGSSVWYDYRLLSCYNDTTRNNHSMVKHILHKPIVFLKEVVDASHIYVNPVAYLPYYGVRMENSLKGDDTISFGTRNFACYPCLRDGDAFGLAMEFVV